MPFKGRGATANCFQPREYNREVGLGLPLAAQISLSLSTPPHLSGYLKPRTGSNHAKFQGSTVFTVTFLFTGVSRVLLPPMFGILCDEMWIRPI